MVPLGVEGGHVRFPLVGATILATCVVLFLATWVVEPNPMGENPEQLSSVIDYWQERPYLEFSEGFTRSFLPKKVHALVASKRSAWLENNVRPSESVVASEQAELARLEVEAMASVKPTLFRRLALSSDRGLAQPGWLTHMFLHFGWFHLLGNMLFLYAVALLLEDAWGRGLFLAFYLLGGLVSAAAEFALNRGGAMVMAGASGAVFACIGAAVVRFASRRMRVGYFLLLFVFPRVGSFAVPMWLWGVFKAGGEVLDLATGASHGVAVMAHVAGCLFGAVVALGMKAAGLDKSFVASDEVSDPLAPSFHEEIVQANEALARGDRQAARYAYEEARRRRPNDLDAELGLMQLDFSEGFRSRGGQRLERVFQTLIRANERTRAVQVFVGAWQSLQPGDLRPAFAFQLLRTLTTSDVPRETLRRLAREAASESGTTEVPALLRAAELALDARDVDDAADSLRRVRATKAIAPEFVGKLTALEARVQEAGGPVLGAQPGVSSSPSGLVSAPTDATGDHLFSADPGPLVVAKTRRTFRASVVAARSGQLELQLLSGAPRTVSLEEVKAVGAGLVVTNDDRKVLVILLLLDPGNATTPATLVRLDSDTAEIQKLRPNATPQEAYTSFVRWVVERTNAHALPSREQLLAGKFKLYAGLDALETALFPHSAQSK